MRAAEYAPRDRLYLLERLYGLAGVVKRCVGVHAERRRVHLYANALYEDPGATLADLHEAVTTLEDSERTARRVFGSDHPFTEEIESVLKNGRAMLRARETPSTSA